jgi:hypothetical protein
MSGIEVMRWGDLADEVAAALGTRPLERDQSAQEPAVAGGDAAIERDELA